MQSTANQSTITLPWRKNSLPTSSSALTACIIKNYVVDTMARITTIITSVDQETGQMTVIPVETKGIWTKMAVFQDQITKIQTVGRTALVATGPTAKNFSLAVTVTPADRITRISLIGNFASKILSAEPEMTAKIWMKITIPASVDPP